MLPQLCQQWRKRLQGLYYDSGVLGWCSVDATEAVAWAVIVHTDGMNSMHILLAAPGVAVTAEVTAQGKARQCCTTLALQGACPVSTLCIQAVLPSLVDCL